MQSSTTQFCYCFATQNRVELKEFQCLPGGEQVKIFDNKSYWLLAASCLATPLTLCMLSNHPIEWAERDRPFHPTRPKSGRAGAPNAWVTQAKPWVAQWKTLGDQSTP